MVTSASHQHLERMLDEALTKADSHKAAMKKHFGRRWSRPRWWVLALGLLFFIALSSFLAYRFIPAVSVKVAALRANVSAAIPGYAPMGYSISGPIEYQKGQVTMNYAAKDAKEYAVVQEATNWDSASLAANVVQDNSQVQTSQVKGTTVYIYGPENDATWVSNGKRYTITGNASLSSDQILKIAESLN